jgi:hypothetical protein
MPIRHSYVVLMRWMVIYGYEVLGGGLNLNSTNNPDHSDPPYQGKISHGRAGNRTWDLMISSQKHRPLDHEFGRVLYCLNCVVCVITLGIRFLTCFVCTAE